MSHKLFRFDKQKISLNSMILYNFRNLITHIFKIKIDTRIKTTSAEIGIYKWLKEIHRKRKEKKNSHTYMFLFGKYNNHIKVRHAFSNLWIISISCKTVLKSSLNISV